MSDIDFDFSDLNKLVADLGDVPAGSRQNIRKAVEVTARKVKDGWREKLVGSSSLPALAYAVSYDVTSDNSSRAPVSAEIGVDKEKAQGPLGNISEFGSIKNAPRGYGAASLAENIADFEDGLSIAIVPKL